ncbi:MAG: hypothetical protein ACNA7L_12665, partial [Roseinatronobacter sp.]
PPSYLFKFHICQTAQDKNIHSATPISAQPHANLPRKSRSQEPLWLPTPTTFPPPVKRYLGNTNIHRKREIHKTVVFLIPPKESSWARNIDARPAPFGVLK